MVDNRKRTRTVGWWTSGSDKDPTNDNAKPNVVALYKRVVTRPRLRAFGKLHSPFHRVETVPLTRAKQQSIRHARHNGHRMGENNGKSVCSQLDPLIIFGRLLFVRPLEPVVDRQHLFWVSRLSANLSNITDIPTEPGKHFRFFPSGHNGRYFAVLLHTTGSPVN